ncbi:MAG TPA: CidA/LrgA family protein [Limnobacter sp.]|nr:CidA/LrgA family protein [Limnobacter sp.]
MTVLLFFQVVGELISFALFPSIHGPAIGLILLLLYFFLSEKGVQPDMQATSDMFTSNLALLFVPAGVGIVAYFGLFASMGLPILLTLVFSSLITLAVTALILDWLAMLFMPGPVSREEGDAKNE